MNFPMCVYTQVTTPQLQIQNISSSQKAPLGPFLVGSTHPAEGTTILTLSL